MIDERTRELIHAGLDGELGEGEKEALRQALSASDEAREYQASMEELDAFLTRVPNQEPPASMHASIMNSIQLPGRRRGGLAFGFGQFPGFVRYGFAVAAGLLLAIGMYEYRPGTDGAPDMTSMVGTIMPGRTALEGERLDGFSFEIDQLSSEVALVRREDALVLDMQLDAAGPISVTVDFAGEGLQFDAIAQMQSDLDSIEIADRNIRIQANGRQHFAVMLHSDPLQLANARILLNWSSQGKSLKTVELDVN